MISEFVVSNPGLTDLIPVMSGNQACIKNHNSGSAIRDYYLIHYILDGKGIFQHGGKTYHLKKGQFFLICPDELCFYQADSENPWQYIWIAFKGGKAAEFLKRAGLGLDNPIYSGEGITALFEGLYEDMKNDAVDQLNNYYYLLSKIYEMFRHLPAIEKKEKITDLYIGQVKNYIATLYSQDISVEKLARFCGLDRRYLCRIFKADIGMTLQQYLLNTRLEKAYSLVISSQLSIGDISRSVGYHDYYNFSRMFKKKFGKSPLMLRQNQ